MPSGINKIGINSGRFTKERLLGNKNVFNKHWKWTKPHPSKLSPKNKKIADKNRYAKYKSKNREICIARTVKSNRKRRAYFRELTITHYGGNPPKCNCCGEVERKFLTLDHIKGGGRKHRKEMNNKSGGVHGQLVKNNFPDGYQVLCMNCNWGKFINNGQCPHKNYE